jgi:undecaprenyl pyrophosphate phosphatase UppP
MQPSSSRLTLSTFMIGVVISGLVGAIAIHLRLNSVRQIGFGVFAWYMIWVCTSERACLSDASVD